MCVLDLQHPCASRERRAPLSMGHCPCTCLGHSLCSSTQPPLAPHKCVGHDLDVWVTRNPSPAPAASAVPRWAPLTPTSCWQAGYGSPWRTDLCSARPNQDPLLHSCTKGCTQGCTKGQHTHTHAPVRACTRPYIERRYAPTRMPPSALTGRHMAMPARALQHHPFPTCPPHPLGTSSSKRVRAARQRTPTQCPVGHCGHPMAGVCEHGHTCTRTRLHTSCRCWLVWASVNVVQAQPGCPLTLVLHSPA